MLSDGSLLVRAMRESVASVVCTVENSHGKDSIVYTVAVVRPPVAPTLRVSWLIISIHIYTYLYLYLGQQNHRGLHHPLLESSTQRRGAGAG